MLRKSLQFLARSPWSALWLMLTTVPLTGTMGGAEEFEGILYHELKVNPAEQTIRLFWKDDGGRPYKSFRALEAALATKSERLIFAMNAGIYQPGWIPEGLHVEEGREWVALNRQGPPPREPGKFTPNFYLLPNGVFYLLPSHRAGVLETGRYASAGLAPRIAVQSGPLLLAGGRIHPVFEAGSPSRLIRNGVGVDTAGRVHFIATDRSERGRVNFHHFARLFQSLDCPDALYLDGDISEFYLRAEGLEVPLTTDFAAIFAITEKISK